jgi:predicted nucleic acid-binding protein
VSARKSGKKFQRKKRVLEPTSKSMTIELSQAEAWAKFKEVFDANKKKRLLRELQS